MTIRRSFALTLLTAWVLISYSADAQTWNQVSSDEFNAAYGTPIDSTKWRFDTGNLGVNNEIEFYCAPGGQSPCDPSNPNAYLDGNGNLVIQAIRLNSDVAPGSNSWTSARLNTGNNLANFQYGRIEARMQLPVGPGIWPAFWALGSNIATTPWPGCGEMDFMENVPATGGLGPNAIKSTIHGPGYSGSNGLGQSFTFPNGGDVASFHVYGAIWSPFMVQFYVDDPNNVFFIRTASDVPGGTHWVFNHQFFLLANLAIGGTGSWPGPPDSTTPSPAKVLVDYVRAYQPATIAPPNMENPSPITVKAGSPGSTNMTLNSISGTGRVYLSCSLTAPKASCSMNTGNPLNGSVVDFSSSSKATATVSVNTTPNSPALAVLSGTSASWRWQVNIAAILLAGMLILLPRPARRFVFATTVLLSLAALAVGCGNSGSGGGGDNGTPPGSYTITVNAYTLSSDPSNSSTFGTVSIPLTVN